MRRSLVLGLIALGLAIGCARTNHLRPSDTTAQLRNVPAPQASASSLTIVTFNAKMPSARTLLAAIRDSDKLLAADVIMLQEVEAKDGEAESRTGQVARALGRSHVYAPGHEYRDGGTLGVAIISRYPLADPHIIELSEHHVVFNSGRRIALTATIDVGGSPVALYNVHLENRINPDDRARQFRPVLEHAAQSPAHTVVIGGDLNTTPFRWIGHVVPVPVGGQLSRIERQVRRYGFDVPLRRSGPTSKWLGMRLDALYTRGADVSQFAVLRDVRGSDHYPVWAQLSPRPVYSSSSPTKSSSSPVKSRVRHAPLRNRHTINTASSAR